MNTLAKNLMINNNYYVSISRHKKAKNVLLATYPKNIFFQPPLQAETFQYYIEDNEILVTNLFSKETKKIKTNMLTKRILIVCDIFARATKRGVQPELIIPKNKSGILVNLLSFPNNMKKEEKNILKILSSAIKKENIHVHEQYKEIYQQFTELLENGGII